MEINLDSTSENYLFEKFPLFEQIGKEKFDIKLWILIKGIKNQTGEGVLLNALGHKPCVVMLEQNVTAVDIKELLAEMENKHLIVMEKNMSEYVKKYYVTMNTATELNRILMQLNLTKVLADREECVKILKKCGYYHIGGGKLDEIRKYGTNAAHFLNDENGIATSKLIKAVLTHFLHESAKNAATKIFPGFT